MPNPSVDRMALAIAQADYLGDVATCQRFGISCRTLQRWRHRSKRDSALAANVAAKKRILLETWQDEAIAPLKTAFEELARRMPAACTADDAKLIYAIAGTVKILGELKLSAGVLLEE
jgi:hypothetical protein